jgi:AraC family transcriptional regulator, transcriptional activator of pobA
MPESKKIIYYGLYGEENRPFLPDFVHCERIEIRSKASDWEIKPHIHSNLCQIFLIEKGSVICQFEDETIELTVPCILTLPENTVHGFSFSPEISGLVVTISSSFLDNLFQSSTPVLAAMREVHIIPFAETDKKWLVLNGVMERLHEELYDSLPERAITMKACFAFLFVEVFRFADVKAAVKPIDNKNLKYFRAFQRSIRQSSTPQKTIANYAKELTITPVHLNRICHAIEGKSALQIVQNHLITEAERYLKYTTYSISEISYLLNFEDPCYFSRLFKKHLGVSPKGFREKI